MNAMKFKRCFLFSNYIIKSTMVTRKNAEGWHQIKIKRLLDEVNFYSIHNQIMLVSKWVAMLAKGESLLVDPTGLFFHFLTSYRRNNR